MKSKFIFIFDDRIHDGLQVHHVMVGTSQREQIAAAKIEAAATKNHNIFFRKYDMDVCKFLNKLSCQLYPELSPDAAKAKFFIFNEKFNETPQQILSLLPPILKLRPPRTTTSFSGSTTPAADSFFHPTLTTSKT